MLAKNINGSEPGMMIDNRDTQETGERVKSSRPVRDNRKTISPQTEKK